jgi:hypothetical protein
MAAEGCGVEVGSDDSTGTGADVAGELIPGTGAEVAGKLIPSTGAEVAGELIPGTLSNEKEQPLSSNTNRLSRESSLRIDELTK